MEERQPPEPSGPPLTGAAALVQRYRAPVLPDGRRPLVLCVDDDDVVLKVRQVLLEMAGYQIEVAASGGEALRLAAERTPDLVLLDMRMDPMNGEQTARALREHWPLLPILVVTADVLAVSPVLRGLVQGVVCKGLPAEELLRAIWDVFQQH